MPVTRLGVVRAVGQAALLSLSLWMVSSAAVSHSRPRQAPDPEVQKRLARVVEFVLQRGKETTLPPNLSSQLGVVSRKAEKCPVKQLTARVTTNLVQAFNVSTENHDDVILFVAHPSANSAEHTVNLEDVTCYLTSPKGILRAVAVAGIGSGGSKPITADDRKDFDKELKFWLDRFAPVYPPAPKIPSAPK